MAGLLNIDFEDPETAGLLGLAGGLFAAGAPSRTRIGTGQAIMAGLQGMQQGQQGARDYAINQELLRRKKAADDLNMEMNQFEFGQKKQTVADQKLARDAMIKYAKMRQAGMNQQQNQPQVQMQSQSSAHGYSIQPSNADNSDSPNVYGLDLSKVTPQQMQALQAKDPEAFYNGVNNFAQTRGQNLPQIQQQNQPIQRGKGSAIQAQIDDLNKQADFYDSEGVPTGDALRQKAIELTKLLPKYANDYRVVMGADGVPRNVRLADDGTEIFSDSGVAEKLHFGDNGQQLLGMNAYTGKVQSANQKFQSPESLASNAVTMRGQNMTDTRARDLNEITRQGQQTQVINDPTRGIMLVDKGTARVTQGVGANGEPIAGESMAKKTTGANQLVPVIQDAKDLLKNATGSYAGMAFDKAYQFMGGATKGAEAIAKLRVLEGQLMMNQPRMEGPQSDKDVALYRQMAGQIGDPSVPSKIKSAALDQIEKLNSKYATTQPVKPTSNVPNDIQDLLNLYGGK